MASGKMLLGAAFIMLFHTACLLYASNLDALQDHLLSALGPVDENNMWDSAVRVQHALCSAISTCSKSVTDVSLPSPPGGLEQYTRGCCQPCSCNSNCVYTSNCCLEKMVELGLNGQQPPASYSACIRTDMREYSETPHVTKDMQKIRMVVRCPKDTEGRPNELLCENPDPYDIEQVTPVTSLDTNLTYRNEFCAVCNNDTSIISWVPTLSLPVFFYYSDSLDFEFNNTIQILKGILESRHANLFFDVPQRVEYSVVRNVCPQAAPVFTSCNMTGLWGSYDSFVDWACSAYTAPYLETRGSQTMSFANVFCFLCNSPSFAPHQTPSSNCRIKINGTKSTTNAITALLRVYDTSQKGINEQLGESSQKCTCTEFWDPFKTVCRPLECPPLEQWINCSCQPFMNTISELPVAVMLEIKPAVMSKENQLPPDGASTDDLHTKIRQRALAEFRTKFVHTEVQESFIYLRNVTEAWSYVFGFVVKVQAGYDTKEQLYDLLTFSRVINVSDTEYLLCLEQRVRPEKETKTLLDLERNTTLTLLPPKLSDTFFKGQAFTSLLYCQQVSLSPQEYEIKDYVLTLLKPSIRIFNYRSGYSTKNTFVCVSDYLASSLQGGYTSGARTGQASNTAVALLSAFVLILKLACCPL